MMRWWDDDKEEIRNYVYQVCAEHFSQYHGKYIILGFKDNNHYYVLSQTNKWTLCMWDPQAVKDIQIIFDVEGRLAKLILWNW